MKHIPLLCLGAFLAGTALHSASLSIPPQHVTVYQNESEFAGWPANEGTWSWGDEILVAAWVSEYEEQENTHNHAPNKPQRLQFARSLDGGETWTPEVHENVRPPKYLSPVNFTGNINFANPDLAMRWRRDSFFVSNDRGNLWEGPYLIPRFSEAGSPNARTCYIPIDSSSCLFLANYDYASRNGTYSRTAAFKTTDGGASYQFLSWIGPDWGETLTEAQLETGLVSSIMPQVVKIANNHYITSLRQRQNNAKWSDIYESTDGGLTWSFVSQLERGSTNPVALTYMGNQTLVAAYGNRRGGSTPVGIYAKVSHDLGRTWEDEVTLRADAREWDIGYATSVLRPDNKITTLYYYTTEQHYPNFIAATVWDPEAITDNSRLPLSDSLVVNEQFSDGDRFTVTQNESGTYTSLNWYCRNSAYISASSSGMTLNTVGISGQAAGGQFQDTPIIITENGSLTLSFDFTPTRTPAETDNFTFQVGVFDSRKESANTFAEGGLFSDQFSHAGYKAVLVPQGSTSLSIAKRREVAGALIHSANTYTDLGAQAVSASFTSNVTYNASLEIKRSSGTQSTLTWRISGGDLTSPLTLSAMDTSGPYSSFDTIAFYLPRNSFNPCITNIRLTAETALQFLQQPQSQTIDERQPLTLSALLSGGNLQYQWFKDGVPVPGANTNTLKLAEATLEDAGQYTLRASDSANNSLLSNTAVVTVTPRNGPPIIHTQPLSQTIAPGSTLILSIDASGTRPLAYQWHKDGNPIPEATLPSLTINDVDNTASGIYTCLVTNAENQSLSSDPAIVNIQIPHVLSDLVVDEQFSDGDRVTVTQNNTGTFTSLNWVSRYPGNVTTSTHGLTALNPTGSTGQSLVAQLPSPLTLATYGNLSLSVDFTPTKTPGSEDIAFQFGLFDSQGNSGNVFFEDGGAFNANISSPGYRARLNPRSALLFLDKRLNQTGGLFNSPGVYTNLSSQVVPPLVANGNYRATLIITRRSPTTTTLTTTLSGTGIAEPITLSSEDRESPTISFDTLGFYFRGAAGNPQLTGIQLMSNTLIEVITHPQSRTIEEQQDLILSATVSGFNHSYQWLKDGVPVPGAEAPLLKISPARPSDSGRYTLKITTYDGYELTSNEALVSVTRREGAPLIHRQTKSQTLFPGSSLTLTAEATGTEPLSYQWYKNGQLIPGANGPTYTITDSTLTDAGSYTCVVTNGGSQNVTSDPIIITTQITPALSKYFSDNMVLQRNKAIPVWGVGNPSDIIIVTFAGKTYTANPDTNGHWKLLLDSQPANTTPQTLSFSAGDQNKTISNILIGDVWLCAGQSNMALTVGNIRDASSNAPTAEEIAQATEDINKTLAYPYIRSYRSYLAYDINGPHENNDGIWHEASADSVSKVSAVGYYFARHLAQTTHENIPIGILNVNWGGTPIETWVSKEFLQSHPEFSRYIPDPDMDPTAISKVTPTACYNAMIHPIRHSSLAGILMYQGEANDGRYHEYSRLFPAMIEDWRNNVFQDLRLPFYFVQLANRITGAPWVELRDAQMAALALDNTDVAVTIDIGNDNNIHPSNKWDVGLRLALNALHHAYGYTSLENSGPVLTEATTKSGVLTLTFSHAGGMLLDAEKIRENIPAFEISGTDGNYYPAALGSITQINATTATLTMSSEDVPSPAYVRYAWHNTPSVPLYNSFTDVISGETRRLPARPFKSALVEIPPGPDLSTLSEAELLAYALTEDATISTNGTLTHLPEASLNGSGFLQLSFTPYHPDLQYEVQESSNLQTWTTIQIIDGGSEESVSVNATTNASTNPRLFLRLKVSPK